ncbi:MULTISPECIES: hypothetical protein [Paenibacillus]|uniref:hypothetical protein n=1 Tax=Paenibacillus TaxID=44249 RepID=UPI000838ADC4|nr:MULTISPECIES: hypothetical protein [Paenibacillus]GIP19937.1 hypothetical protein J22TS3_02120 [Paenibacillus sp. J22TS3]
MARSFEKQVEKNRQKILMQQKKQGVQPGKLGVKGEGDTFKGRNIILPVVLILFGGMYGSLGFIGKNTEINSFLYWITIGLYIMLGVVVFIRKPYLRVGQKALYTSKFNRDRMLSAESIQKIVLSQGMVSIVPKGNGQKWNFSRSRNRFDTAAMGERLKEFGKTNNVTVENH